MNFHHQYFYSTLTLAYLKVVTLRLDVTGTALL